MPPVPDGGDLPLEEHSRVASHSIKS